VYKRARKLKDTCIERGEGHVGVESRYSKKGVFLR
jgi:hypothetical protein